MSLITLLLGVALLAPAGHLDRPPRPAAVYVCAQAGPARMFNPAVSGSRNTQQLCQWISPGERPPLGAR